MFCEAPNTGRVWIGDGCFLGEWTYIMAMGGFHLGNYSGIAGQSFVLTVDHAYRGAATIPFGDVRLVKPVWVEDYVWIGARVCLLPGVRIGEGAIVGLGAVVSQDVPPRAIVMGNPARIVGYRDKGEFEKLRAERAVRRLPTKCTQLVVPALTRKKFARELDKLGLWLRDCAPLI